MSSIIKHNRIQQQGTIQLGQVQKREQPMLTSGETPVVDMSQYLEEAKTIKLEAEDAAVQILENARREAEAILESARREMADRYQQQESELAHRRQVAAEESTQLLEATTKECEKLLVEAQEEKQKLLEEAEPEVVDIIKQLVARIVNVKVLQDEKWLPLIVQKMLVSEKLAEPIRIQVAPDTYEQQRELLEEGLAHYHYPYQIESIAHLETSTCIVETSGGSIYYDIREGLEEVLQLVDTLQQLT
ncbi:MAG: FliH/SctL family protein [Cellulosilyticaceae bacterium]